VVDHASPTVRRRRLGVELRRLRDAAGFTCEQAGARLDFSASKVSRMETARVPVRVVDIQAMCRLYGASEETAASLTALARESKQQGWWHSFDDVLPDWFATYVGLEPEAAAIRTYEIHVVPGLLQTEMYTEALLECSDLATKEKRERIAAVRRNRQNILSAETPPHYWAVLCEEALHRQVGGPEIMRDQLTHLVTMSEIPHVTVQIIPYGQGAHPAMVTPFVVFTFRERSDSDVIYLEYLGGGLYLEKPEEVERFRLSFDHLVASANPPRQSAEMIKAAIKALL
jgi:hypothetical protein